MNTIHEIKELAIKGDLIHWKNEGYYVKYDKECDRFLVIYEHNQNAVTLNDSYNPHDFFLKNERKEAINKLKEFISAFNSAPEFIWNSENDNRKRLAESALETLINSNPGIFSLRCAINYAKSL